MLSQRGKSHKRDITPCRMYVCNILEPAFECSGFDIEGQVSGSARPKERFLVKYTIAISIKVSTFNCSPAWFVIREYVIYE